MDDDCIVTALVVIDKTMQALRHQDDVRRPAVLIDLAKCKRNAAPRERQGIHPYPQGASCGTCIARLPHPRREAPGGRGSITAQSAHRDPTPRAAG